MSVDPQISQAIIPVVIIGGGAAGLAAAIEAGQYFAGQTTLAHDSGSYPVVLLESQNRVGRKILATGNGRCNLSHVPLTDSDYHSTEQIVPNQILRRFDGPKTLEWFRSLGLFCRIDDDGRVFPYSYQAAAVLDILRLKIEQLPVSVLTEKPVTHVKREQQGFRIFTADGTTIRAHTAILATGGLAAPAFGCDGSGYLLAQALGHPIIQPFPALVQICTQKENVKGLEGIRIEGTATLEWQNRPLRCETGEILFTNYGLSGPPILQLSRGVQQVLNSDKPNGLTIRIDFLPGLDEQAIIGWLTERRNQNPERPLEHLWTGLLHKKIGQMLTKKILGISLASQAGSISDDHLDRLARAVKNECLTVTGTRGWREAQVTAGGLSAAFFNSETLESTLIPGLYAAGEVLDVDGDCGGYNLQWAWSSGRCAGYEAALAVCSK